MPGRQEAFVVPGEKLETALIPEPVVEPPGRPGPEPPGPLPETPGWESLEERGRPGAALLKPERSGRETRA